MTRKVGNAVARNQIKRLVREVFRQNRGALPVGFDTGFDTGFDMGFDMVWVAKQQAAGVTFSQVAADFGLLLQELAKPYEPGRKRRSGKRKPRGGA